MGLFRGIDPEGLMALALSVERQTQSSKQRASVVRSLLGRRGRVAAGRTFGAAVAGVEHWGLESATNLRWRAEAIRAGQEAGLNILTGLRAQFAAEAVFSIRSVDAAYEDWLRQIEAGGQRVNTAVANISSWLSQGWTDWDVTNTDLQNIRTTLESLSGDELDRVIAALSPSQLERWITEMGYRVNGFSRGEKRDLFAMLAANASGEALGKLHDALLRAGGDEAAFDFGVAIQTVAADQIIVDFVAYAVAQDLAALQYSTLAPAIALNGIEDNQSLDAAAGAIAAREGALDLLLVDSFVADTRNESDVSTGLLAALNRTTPITTRAVIFATLTQLTALPEDELTILIEDRQPAESQSNETTSRRLVEATRSGALDTATTMFEHDPNAVIQELATSIDPSGSITTSYWAILVAGGQGGTIRRILDQLRGGTVVQADTFSSAGLDPDYRFPHARNLAFAAATLDTALIRHAEQAKGDIDAIVGLADVITAAAGLITGIGEVAGTALGTGADYGVSAYGEHTKDGIDEQLSALIDRATENLLPPEDVQQTDLVTDGAMSAWIHVFRSIHPLA